MSAKSEPGLRAPQSRTKVGAVTGGTIIGQLNRRSGGHERSEERS
ncbi:hypothetical protein [Micromonospora sp. CPCC 205558]